MESESREIYQAIREEIVSALVREVCGEPSGEYPQPRTWVCASCGVEHLPGEHDFRRCSWQQRQEELYAGREAEETADDQR
jgi:hypothetical protein